MHGNLCKPLTLSAGLGLIALVASSAGAVTAPDDVYVGIEPQRVLTYDTHTQRQLANHASWRAFLEAEGDGWRAVFDEGTGSPHRMWGPGIDIGPVDTADQVTAGMLDFIERNAHTLGVTDTELAVRSVSYVERMDTWYVQIDVVRGGAAIYRAGLTARIKHGNLIMVGADTYPDIPVHGGVEISTDTALSVAIEDGPAPDAEHDVESVQLATLADESDGIVTLRTTWMTRTRTQSPPGIWVTFVDAQSGKLLSVHNEVRFSNISGEHDVRTIDGNMTVSPMPLLEVSADGLSDYADNNGDFSLGGGPFNADVEGSYLRVVNRNGSDGDKQWSGDGVWTDADATQGEIDSYIFLHHVRDWGLANAPEVAMSTKELTSYVNSTSGSCNAYYDGNVNFYEKQGSCNNTARIADVNYHEWGHGFHGWSLLAGVWDGSLGEGAADVVSIFLTGDPLIAPYFYTDGWGIRELESNKIYPEDYDASGSNVHSNGLIFGGAIWDLWQILKADYGETTGTQIATDIFTGLLKGGPTVEESYYEAIVADDDDGDLGNGTPHICQIIEAFGAHGLGPGEGGALLIEHEPLFAEPADVDLIVDVAFSELAPDCPAASVTGGGVVWRADGGDWEVAPFELEAMSATAAIPGHPLGTFIEYYIEVDTVDAEVNSPAGGHINPFTFHVGGVLEVYCEDFEVDDGGYVHELVSGEESEGADDWQWGVPYGTSSSDPSFAYSGDFVWGNDLGPEGYNGDYQNDKWNRLTGPIVEMGHYADVFLHYQRWLAVEDGYYDQASILADGTKVWTNWATAEWGEDHHLDDQWVGHAVDLMGEANDGDVQISWDLETDGGLGFGGWNIDDVCLFAPATADNRLGITDFVATDDIDASQVQFTWTNPQHAPVAEVAIVRNAERFPTGIDDGDVVYSDTDPEPGAPAEASDTEAIGTFFYAVYGFDGSEWLGWTVEGWNADAGAATGTGIPEDPEDPNGGPGGEANAGEDVGSVSLQSGGCGCATPAAPALPWLALGFAGLVATRRRKN